MGEKDRECEQKQQNSVNCSGHLISRKLRERNKILKIYLFNYAFYDGQKEQNEPVGEYSF